MVERKKSEVKASSGAPGNDMSSGPHLFPRKAIAMVIGARLAGARKNAKFTQVALAAKLGVVSAYVSMIELGQRLPSIEVLVAWAGACTVPVSKFFTDLEAAVKAGR